MKTSIILSFSLLAMQCTCAPPIQNLLNIVSGELEPVTHPVPSSAGPPTGPSFGLIHSRPTLARARSLDAAREEVARALGGTLGERDPELARELVDAIAKATLRDPSLAKLVEEATRPEEDPVVARAHAAQLDAAIVEAAERNPTIARPLKRLRKAEQEAALERAREEVARALGETLAEINPELARELVDVIAKATMRDSALARAVQDATRTEEDPGVARAHAAQLDAAIEEAAKRNPAIARPLKRLRKAEQEAALERAREEVARALGGTLGERDPELARKLVDAIAKATMRDPALARAVQDATRTEEDPRVAQAHVEQLNAAIAHAAQVDPALRQVLQRVRIADGTETKSWIGGYFLLAGTGIGLISPPIIYIVKHFTGYNP